MDKELAKKERFIKARGYKKYKGYKIDTDELEDGIRYIPKEDIADAFPIVTFYMQDDSEFATEDIDEIIDMIEYDESIKYEDKAK